MQLRSHSLVTGEVLGSTVTEEIWAIIRQSGVGCFICEMCVTFSMEEQSYRYYISASHAL